MSDFIKTQDSDGIAILTWNCVDRPMNIMSEQGFVDLNELVENCISDQSVTGVIITSAKKDFAAGMDLGVIAKTKEKKSRQSSTRLL
jgi:3-hydroxyacyl-CoA dehydrogenase/enoyl-CoA hydratase/3-hydroxybutyryl-CoA epimerase